MSGGHQVDANKFSRHFAIDTFLPKLRRVAKQAGLKVVYTGLLLFYVLQEDIPKRSKAIIYSALGYLVFPLDAIPDAIPIAGYTDDIGVLFLALATVAMYINDDVKNKAKAKLHTWFGDIEESELREVDNQLEIQE
jgi:uncharacterized membrane protein YkvA (DUF1232 family)